MEVAPTTKSLASKLAEVMAAVDRVPKRGHNDFHHYDYATEADIVALVRQELASRQVVLLPEITGVTRVPIGEKGEVLTTLTMNFTFKDGETNETERREWLGSGSDKSDKGAYKAMTGGEKYFLLKTFLIPTGDDPEREIEIPQMAPLGEPRPGSTKPKPARVESRPTNTAEPPPPSDKDAPPTLPPMNVNRAGKKVDTKPLAGDLASSDIPFLWLIAVVMPVLYFLA